MSYGDFKTIDEVVEKFDLKVVSEPFIERLPIEIDNYPFEKIKGKVQNEMSKRRVGKAIAKPTIFMVFKHRKIQF